MKIWKSFGALLLVLWMLFGVLSPLALAAEVSVDEDGFVIWEMSENGTVVTGNGRTYSYISTQGPGYNKLEPDWGAVYEFANAVVCGDRTFTVHSSSKDGEILILRSVGGLYRIYATEATRASLTNLKNGTPDAYTLFKYNNRDTTYAPLTAEQGRDFLAGLSGYRVLYDVALLEEAPHYSLFGGMVDGTVCYEAGRFYRLGEHTYGYVNHTALDNTYFDADGFFSYRSGKVEMLVLNENSTALLESYLERANSTTPGMKYEYMVNWAYPPESIFPRWLFYLTLVVLSLLPAAALITVGLILTLKYPARKGRWLTVAGLGVIWLAVSVALIVHLAVFGA